MLAAKEADMSALKLPPAVYISSDLKYISAYRTLYILFHNYVTLLTGGKHESPQATEPTENFILLHCNNKTC